MNIRKIALTLTASLLTGAFAAAQGTATQHGYACTFDSMLVSNGTWSIGSTSSADIVSYAGRGAFATVGLGGPAPVGQGLSLAPYGMCGELWTNPISTVPVINPQPGGQVIAYSLDVPNNAAFVGLPLTFQAMIVAPWFRGGAAPTNALHVVIGQ